MVVGIRPRVSVSWISMIVALLFSFSERDDPGCEKAHLFEKAPFSIGTALDVEKLKNEEAYWTTALDQFNSFTPEKIMKPQYIHPGKDRYDFTEVDHLMDFCDQHKIRLHGHTLVWHKALP